MTRFAHRLARFRALSCGDRRTLLAAASLMPIFWLCLRLMSLARLQVWLQRRHVELPAPLQFDAIQGMGNLVNIAAHHTLGPRNCLTRSLVLVWLLRRRGIETQLRIGARLGQGALDAHAWVECEGVPVNDESDVSERFASFGDLVPLSAFHEP